MISVTRLNEHEMVINSDLVELIESTPDTTITMTTGRKVIVRESVETLLARIVEYKRSIGNIDNIGTRR